MILTNLIYILENFVDSQELYVELYRDHEVFYTSTPQQQSQDEDRTITWDLENIELSLSLTELLDKKVKLRIKGKDLIESDEVIGKAVLSCQNIVQGNGELVELKDKVFTKTEEKNGKYIIKGRYIVDS